MALAYQVGNNITPIVIPPHPAIQISCHVATCIWLFREVNGRSPTNEELLQISTKSPTAIVTAIAQQGTQRVQPPSGDLGVTPGSVIVFWDDGAKHSCVALSYKGKIGGYNQLGWFKEGGNHTYTEHNVSELNWGTGKHKDQVQAHKDNWYRVRSTFESTAKVIFIQQYSD